VGSLGSVPECVADSGRTVVGESFLVAIWALFAPGWLDEPAQTPGEHLVHGAVVVVALHG
jgi:hypothetical protein